MEIEVAYGLIQYIEPGDGDEKAAYNSIADKQNAEQFPPPGTHGVLKNFGKGRVINVQM